MLYTSVGPELAWHDVDGEAATITRRGSISAGLNVQYAWPDANQRVLYVAATNGGPGIKGDRHELSAFRIDPASGALTAFGPVQKLPSRPIHVSLDSRDEFVLTAFNLPSAVTVHHIAADGSVGTQVPQTAPLDTGSFAHQVRATPSNKFVLLQTRGNHAEGDQAEDPGAVKIFRFDKGVLSNFRSHAPNGGHGFGPRHIDFHPTEPWAYLSVETQNRLDMFHLDGAEGLRGPVFQADTLVQPDRVAPRQMAGAIHVHPNGRFVYVSNRNWGEGGEDNIAVFAIDAGSGQPTLIQHAFPQSVHVRTFTIDAEAKLLIAASIRDFDVTENGRKRVVPAALSVFRIGDDGRLDFVRKIDIDTGEHMLWWCSMIRAGDGRIA